MQHDKLFIATMLSIVFTFLSICSCSKSNTHNIKDNTIQSKNQILEDFFLTIPANLTKAEATKLIESYIVDSIIWDVTNYSYKNKANNFEQVLAEINFGNIDYSFDTDFIVKMNDTTYRNTEPNCFLIFYNNELLALELEFREYIFNKKSTTRELNDSILSMYTSKYGEPTKKNERLETLHIKNKNSEIDVSEIALDNKVMRRWKEDVYSVLNEWSFLNAEIKIITSEYKEYNTLNYKKEEPKEYICHTTHIFYLNKNTIADREQDVRNHRDSIELQNKQREKENQIRDSLTNINSRNIYKRQRI